MFFCKYLAKKNNLIKKYYDEKEHEPASQALLSMRCIVLTSWIRETSAVYNVQGFSQLFFLFLLTSLDHLAPNGRIFLALKQRVWFKKVYHLN